MMRVKNLVRPKLAELRAVEKRVYRNSNSADFNYYYNGKKVYCIRFYYKTHIMHWRHGRKFKRLDFTQSWYTG